MHKEMWADLGQEDIKYPQVAKQQDHIRINADLARLCNMRLI